VGGGVRWGGRPRSAAVILRRVIEQLEDRALQRREFGDQNRRRLAGHFQFITLHVVEDVDLPGGRWGMREITTKGKEARF
jgi:hypothetical protein